MPRRRLVQECLHAGKIRIIEAEKIKKLRARISLNVKTASLRVEATACMHEKRMTQVWVNWETYRRLLAVRGALQRVDGKIRNMDKVIAELIEFWKGHAEALKKPVG